MQDGRMDVKWSVEQVRVLNGNSDPLDFRYFGSRPMDGWVVLASPLKQHPDRIDQCPGQVLESPLPRVLVRSTTRELPTLGRKWTVSHDSDPNPVSAAAGNFGLLSV